MKATTSIDTAKVITHPTTGLDGSETRVPDTGQAGPNQNGAKEHGKGKPESELRAAARRKGLTLKELADLMGVSAGYMSEVSRGRKNMSPALQARVEKALGAPVETAPAECANRQGGVVVAGESTYLRERARERGMTLRQVAERTGLSYGHVVMVSRGQRSLSPAAQARMETVLEAPVKVESAPCADVDPCVLWERMDAHDISQNETARRAGISSAMLSLIMNGQRKASGEVLGRLHRVLFAPSPAELVAPVELRVMGWKKDDRQGVVIRGAGGPESNGKPGGGTIRTGGRVPWGAEVEFAFTTGYDGHGRVFVNHIVDERDCSVMLKRKEAAA